MRVSRPLKYGVVILGNIKFKTCVEKNNKIPGVVKKNLLSCAHYTFKDILVNRTKGTRCKVYLQNESYTTITCSECEEKNFSVGGSKTFKCPKCTYTTDRDLNACKNILLKFVNKN